MTKPLALIAGEDDYASLFTKHYRVTNNLKAITQCDLLVLTGGADISPHLYGEPPHPTVHTNPKRDEVELRLVSIADARKTPVVGICRGAQLLHVYNGGTLKQHVPDHIGRAHMIKTSPHVPFEPESFIVKGDHHQVMSYALNQNTGFTLAHAVFDGAAECIFYPALKHLCVQYHPEWGGPSSRAVQYFNAMLEWCIRGVFVEPDLNEEEL